VDDAEFGIYHQDGVRRAGRDQALDRQRESRGLVPCLGPGVQGELHIRPFNTDVSERRRSEEELRESLRELADLKFALDESSIVAFTDQRGRITYVNDKFCEVSKYSREELVGQDHRIINSSYHPKEYIRNL
jgi:PAS domain-containing protein